MSREYESKRIIPPPGILLPAHLHYQGFEDLPSLMRGANKGNYIVRRNPLYAMTGLYSLELQTPSTSPDVDDIVYAYWFSPILPAVAMTVETTFIYGALTSSFYAEASFQHSFGSKSYYWDAGVRLRPSNGAVQIRDENGDYPTIETIGAISAQRWITIAATIDFINKKYKTIRVGNYVIDVSGYDLERVSGFLPTTRTFLTLINATTQRSQAFFDNVFLQSAVI